MDITQVKNLLQIKTDKHDVYLLEALPLTISEVEDYCGKSFRDDLGNFKPPDGLKKAIAKWIELDMNKAGLKSRSMGEVSYEFETFDIPPSIRKRLNKYRKFRFI